MFGLGDDDDAFFVVWVAAERGDGWELAAEAARFFLLSVCKQLRDPWRLMYHSLVVDIHTI